MEKREAATSIRKSRKAEKRAIERREVREDMNSKQWSALFIFFMVLTSVMSLLIHGYDEKLTEEKLEIGDLTDPIIHHSDDIASNTEKLMFVNECIASYIVDGIAYAVVCLVAWLSFIAGWICLICGVLERR